jgi:hypothetical protein
MTDFPKDPTARQQLFSKVKAQLPEALAMMDTLKEQGYTSKFSALIIDGVRYGEPEPDPDKVFNIEPVAREYFRQQQANSLEFKEAKRKQKLAIESNKRRRKQ